jgi:hypothetical protein
MLVRERSVFVALATHPVADLAAENGGAGLLGYYRAAMAELRVVLELVMIAAHGNLKPDDPDYVV